MKSNCFLNSVQFRVVGLHCLIVICLLIIDPINKMLLNTMINLESILVNKFTLFIMTLRMLFIFYLLHFL